MKMEEYALAVPVTLNPDTPFPESDNYLLGLIGEVGELTDVVKKHLYHGHALDDSYKGSEGTMRDKIVFEAGDVLWYCYACAHGLRVDLPAAVTLLRAEGFVRVGRGLSGLLCRDTNAAVNDIDRFVRFPSSSAIRTEIIGKRLATICLHVESILVAVGSSIEEAMAKNVWKLRTRYPDKFTCLASLNRAI